MRGGSPTKVNAFAGLKDGNFPNLLMGVNWYLQ